MMKRQRIGALAALTAASMSVVVATSATADPLGFLRGMWDVKGGQQTEVVVYTYAVHAPTDAYATRLTVLGFDLLENRDGDTLYVAGDASTGKALTDSGFDAKLMADRTVSWVSPGGRIGNDDTRMTPADTFLGGYHTATGHINHIDQVTSAKPALARKHEFGKTFTGKYPMTAICITKLTQGDCEQGIGRKPKFFLMSQTHAREIAAGEMSYRLIDHLTNNYGSDPEVTNLLDTTEVWVVPVHNPDGLDVVAQGGNMLMQRKNRNETHGKCPGPKAGVDLNRNNGSNFGGASTSTDPCNDTFKGPRADSEPENQALQALWRKLYKPARGNGGNTAAPPDTTGFMLSIHTVAAMNLVPWQYANTPTPNDKSLKAIGQQLKSFNGYRTGQAPQILYAASGGHDDWIYDKLGVASATIELGDEGECGNSNFHPAYSCVDTYWRQNKPALMYLAKVASSPYKSAFGPNVRDIKVDGSQLSATVDGRDYSQAHLGEQAMTTAAVGSVEYSFDPSFASATQMSVAGADVAPVAKTTIDVSARGSGRHMVYVRAKNRDGVAGPAAVAWINE